MSYLKYLDCSGCGRILDSEKLWNLCPDCGKPLFAKYDIKKAAMKFKRNSLKNREKTVWRYREMLPIRQKKFIYSLGEGYTPLMKTKRLGEIVGCSDLYIKDEGNNPTGSFKARGLSVAVSRAVELGAKSFSIPSAGNAAGALSAYAALAGSPTYVFMPRDVPKSFIVECDKLGAHIQLVDGLINDCGIMAAKELPSSGRFDVSTLKEPYRVEGKKTMGYELAEQMQWELPDIIIYPTGGGTGLVGMWKAFEEMQQLGWIGSKRPRMVTVQAEGCAPLVKAFNSGEDQADFWKDAKTIADGLRVPAAIGDFLILEILRNSFGTAIVVTDEEMLAGVNLIGKTTGLFVSPESGATAAALKKLRHKNWITGDEKIVLFSTGSGYKYSHLWYE